MPCPPTQPNTLRIAKHHRVTMPYRPGCWAQPGVCWYGRTGDSFCTRGRSTGMRWAMRPGWVDPRVFRINRPACVDICNQVGYNGYMIRSFCDDRTRDIYHGRRVRRLEAKLATRARRRLEYLNAATGLEDMYFPPSNRFHALQGFQPTRYAIRVSKQWRISFEWEDGHAHDVCFEDYH
jgi:proteic killer suppression protein